MAKDIFTAEELGFTPATQNIFTAEELGLAAPKQKDIFTAEELFGVPSPKITPTSSVTVESAPPLTPEEQVASQAVDTTSATKESSPLFGSLQKGLVGAKQAYQQYMLSELTNLQEADKTKYGANYENAPANELPKIQERDAAIASRLEQVAQYGVERKGIEEKYGVNPLLGAVRKISGSEAYKGADTFDQLKMYGSAILENKADIPGYIASIGLESLPSSIPSIAAAIVAKQGGLGGKGAAIAGGGGSALTEFGNQYAELRAEGMGHKEAWEKAGVKSGVIGIFDAASFNSAGKMASTVMRDVEKGAIAAVAKQTGKELSKQALYGMSGEAGGSFAIGQKLDPIQIIEEGLGEMVGAPLEAVSAYQETKATRPEEVSYKDAMSTILKDKGFTFESKAQEKQIVDQVLEDAATTATDQPSRLKAFAQRITDFSNAEEEKLTGFIDGLKEKFKTLTAPKEVTTEGDTLDKQFADTVRKYQQQGFIAADAEKLANEDFKELGYGDQLIARASKSGISVSGEQSGTLPGTTGTGRTDLAAPSTTTSVAGSGEATELNTLAAQLKAKFNLTDEQALKNAEESLRQKQMVAGMGAPTATSVEPTAEEDLKTLNKIKRRLAEAERAERRSEDTYPNRPTKLKVDKIRAEMDAFFKESEPRRAKRIAELTGQQTTPTEETKPNVLDKGFVWRKDGVDIPIQVVAERLTSDSGEREVVALVNGEEVNIPISQIARNPDFKSATSTKVTPAKPRGRKKAIRTPEEIVAAQELRKQQSDVGRTAINDINRVTKILSEEFNTEADFANETEARDALYQFNNKRQAALEIAHRISVDPNQKNKTAGTRAKELLAKATPQEAENAKLRHETRQKAKAAAAPTLSKEDIGSFGRAITAQDLKDQQQLAITRRRLELQKPISIFTETFKKWFGKSKVVNKDGTPKKMYHGTARDIGKFQPKQANAIFLTEDPKFAEGFTAASKYFMSKEAFSKLPFEQQEKIAKEMFGMAVKNSYMSSKDAQMGIKFLLSSSDSIFSGAFTKWGMEPYVNKFMEPYVENGPNIIPVYAKAEMPFDYENPDHIDFVIEALTPEEKQAALSNVSYDPNRLVTAIQQGAWVHIESAPIQAAMRRVGFDGFYVREGGNKNLAVYNSNQIKSVFNENPTENANISRAEALIDEATNRNNNPKYNTFANATQAINWVAKNGNVFEKFLAKRIAPFLQGVKLVIVDDISQVPKRFQVEFEGAAGLYYESKSGRTIYLDRASGINNTIFLHEALHGATMARINRFIKDFANDVAIPKQLEEAMLEMHRTMFAAKDRLEALKQLGIADDRVLALEKAGAFDDIKEFVAYGMSHPDMQEFLMQTKGVYAGETTESSLFNKFVQGIRKFFEMGAEHKSAMQDLVIITNKLLNAPDEAITQEDTAAAKKLNKKVAAVDKDVQKVNLSVSSSQLTTLVSNMRAKGHDFIDFKPFYNNRFGAMSNSFIRKELIGMLSSDIIRWKGDEIPALQEIDDLQNEMSAMRARLLASAAKKADKLSSFVNKNYNGQKVLGSAMHLARLKKVSADQFYDAANKPKDFNNIVKDDIIVKHYEKLIADPNSSVKQKSAYQGKITTRTDNLKIVFDAWGALGKLKNGHDMYFMVRDYYKDNYTATRLLLDQQIDALPIAAVDKDKLLKSVRLMHEKTTSKQKDNEDADGFDDVELPQLAEDYFPFNRYGEFYLRVTGAPAGREFWLFDTGVARNDFQTKRAEQLGVPEQDGNTFTRGDSISALRTDYTQNDLMLQKIFATIEEITTKLKPNTNIYDDKDVEVATKKANEDFKAKLKDEIYQVYLMTLPERSFRKQFLHSENITGFSSDILRNFKSTATSNSNQLAKLKYSGVIRAAVEKARNSLTNEYRVPDKPLPADERGRLELFINEMDVRAQEELNPPEVGIFTSTVNRLAFFHYLTSVASALTQMLSVPGMVMPNLNVDYGYGAAAKVFARYLPFLKSIGITQEDDAGNVTYTAPSIGSSKLVRNDPIRKRAFQEVVEKYNLFQLTNTSVLTSRARTPQDVSSKAYDYRKQFFNGLTAMFSGTERLSREMTFMMIFDLEYAKTKNFDSSVRIAKDKTGEYLGRYDEFERPRILKNTAGRTIGQMKTYVIFMTSYFMRNGFAIIRATQPIKERADALHRLSGVILMGIVFGGVTKALMYSNICLLIDTFFSGDEEEKQRRRVKNPLTSENSDMRFREFLFETFGNIPVYGIDGTKYDLSDVIQNGPVSVLTDINVGSRVAYNNMGWRDSKEGKTTTETVLNMLLANLGPSVSSGVDVTNAIDDFKNGEINRGLEKIVPGLFKGPLTANRLVKEGAENKGGNDLLSPKELSSINIIAAATGFGITRLARIQEGNYQIQKAQMEASRKRDDVLQKFDKAVANEEGSEKDIVEALENIEKYNRRYPVDKYFISNETIIKSLKTYADRQGRTVRGLYMDKKLMPYLEPYFRTYQPAAQD
jgi:hypothetical protein